MALRPRTLIAGIIPVVIGQALAIRAGQGSALPFLMTVCWMMLLQIGCNLHNDYLDFKRGVDTEERVGPTRVTQSGLISAETVLATSMGLMLAGALMGAWLSYQGGSPVLWMSLFMALCAFTYTGGPFPLSGYALGEVAAFFCFGLLPTAITFFVQTRYLDDSVWLVALAPSLLAAAILCVNNLRDVTTDAKAGKWTTSVLMGASAGRALYVLFVVGSVLVPVALWACGRFGLPILLPLLALPLLREPLRRVLKETGKSLNAALGATAKFEAIFGLLLALGLVMDH